MQQLIVTLKEHTTVEVAQRRGASSFLSDLCHWIR
jgi:hypothetical protein